MRTCATRLIRKMRGAAQAHLLECDDGHSYVVKFRNNPQHRWVLVNEWIGSRIFAQLQISTPEITQVYLTKDFLECFKEVHILAEGIRQEVQPGLHFGSRYAGSQSKAMLYDFLPSVLINRISNLGEFVGALIVDKWTGNMDARQAVFWRTRQSPAAFSREDRGFQASMIDQGSAFGGPNWRFYDVAHHGLHETTAVYQGVNSWEDFQPWLYQVVSFPEMTLQAIRDEVPEEWVENRGDELDLLFEKLLERRRRVPELIASLKAGHVNPFPNWEWYSRKFVPVVRNE
jgi:hypothetical protein